MTLPVKLLVIAHDAALGGAQRSLLEILGRLSPEAYLPVVLAPTPGPFVTAARQLGLRCIWGLTQRAVFFNKPIELVDTLKRPWRLFAHPYVWTLISLLTLPVRVAALSVLAKKEGIQLVYSNTITVLDGALLAMVLGVPTGL